MIDFFNRRFRAADNDKLHQDYEVFSYGADIAPDPGDWAEMSDRSTLVTSKIKSSMMHAPVIDLDVPHCYVPSSTPGHGHLYINKQMTKEAMLEIFEVLAKHGVVEKGYVKATKARGYSAVRTPWTRKPEQKIPDSWENVLTF